MKINYIVGMTSSGKTGFINKVFPSIVPEFVKFMPGRFLFECFEKSGIPNKGGNKNTWNWSESLILQNIKSMAELSFVHGVDLVLDGIPRNSVQFDLLEHEWLEGFDRRFIIMDVGNSEEEILKRIKRLKSRTRFTEKYELERALESCIDFKGVLRKIENLRNRDCDLDFIDIVRYEDDVVKFFNPSPEAIENIFNVMDNTEHLIKAELDIYSSAG